MSWRPAGEEVAARSAGAASRPKGHIPFTPRAKKALELSLREALQLSHNYIGTEHILLGLIREGDGVAAQSWASTRDLTAVRPAVIDLLPAARRQDGRSLRATGLCCDEPGPAAQRARGGASVRAADTPATDARLAEAARLAGGPPVGSHHLLAAALADPESAAARP